jgi:hypothetical protein
MPIENKELYTLESFTSAINNLVYSNTGSVNIRGLHYARNMYQCLGNHLSLDSSLTQSIVSPLTSSIFEEIVSDLLISSENDVLSMHGVGDMFLYQVHELAKDLMIPKDIAESNIVNIAIETVAFVFVSIATTTQRNADNENNAMLTNELYLNKAMCLCVHPLLQTIISTQVSATLNQSNDDRYNIPLLAIKKMKSDNGKEVLQSFMRIIGKFRIHLQQKLSLLNKQLDNNNHNNNNAYLINRGDTDGENDRYGIQKKSIFAARDDSFDTWSDKQAVGDGSDHLTISEIEKLSEFVAYLQSILLKEITSGFLFYFF